MWSYVHVLSLVCSVFFVSDFGSADYVRICSDVEGTKAIECDGGIIRVDEATAAYIPNVNCDSNTPGLPGNPSYECRTERETVYHNCHGKQRCEIQHLIAVVPVSSCVSWTATNFLLVQYTCLQDQELKKAALPIYEEVVGSVLHVFSPLFPDRMPPNQYEFSCTISPKNLEQTGTFRVRITRMFLYIPPDLLTLHCVESLSFIGVLNSDGEADDSLRICSDDFGFEEWNVASDHSVNNELRVAYTKIRDSYGGRFWLQIEGYDNGNPLELKITCPDQSEIPGYSSPTETTTSAATTTTTSATTTAAGEPTTTAATTTTAPATTTAATRFQNNSIIDGGTTTTEETNLNQSQSGSEDDENDTLLYAVIIGVVGLVLLVMILIIILICRHRKRKRSPDDGDPKPESDATPVVGSVLFSNVAQANGDTFNESEARKGAKANVYEDQGINMYSTVDEQDKNKSKAAAGTKVDPVPGMYDSIDDPPSKSDGKNDFMDTDGEMYASVRDPGETEKDDSDSVPDDKYATIDKGRKRKKEVDSDNNNDMEDEMYATVDRNKKKETGITGSNSDQDETIMCENEDIYDTGLNEVQDGEEYYPDADENEGPIKPAEM